MRLVVLALPRMASFMIIHSNWSLNFYCGGWKENLLKYAVKTDCKLNIHQSEIPSLTIADRDPGWPPNIAIWCAGPGIEGWGTVKWLGKQNIVLHTVFSYALSTLWKKIVCPATPLLLMNPMHHPVTMAKNHGFLPRGVEGKAKKFVLKRHLWAMSTWDQLKHWGPVNWSPVSSPETRSCQIH